MYGAVQKLENPETIELRRTAGAWLKERREAVGLSQRQMAARVGVEYHTWISQLEAGRGRIPPDSYRVWADALQMDVREFVMQLLPLYDPVTAAILFPNEAGGAA